MSAGVCRGVSSCPWGSCGGRPGRRTDRKITDLSWACGSGPGPGAVIGPGRGRYGSGGLGDGDLEAEGLDLADVVTDLPVGVETSLVVAGAEVGVPGGRVGQQVPDDDQDGAGDGDLGFGLAPAAGDPSVALAEEGGSAGGAGGGLAEAAAQPAVALVLFAGAGAGPGLAGPGAQPGPGHQVGGGGEAGHVQACFGDDRTGQAGADAGDLGQPGHRGQGGGARAGPGVRAGGPELG